MITPKFELDSEYEVMRAYDYLCDVHEFGLVIMVVCVFWSETPCSNCGDLSKKIRYENCDHETYTISEEDQKIMMKKAKETGKVIYWKRSKNFCEDIHIGVNCLDNSG